MIDLYRLQTFDKKDAEGFVSFNSCTVVSSRIMKGRNNMELKIIHLKNAESFVV